MVVGMLSLRDVHLVGTRPVLLGAKGRAGVLDQFNTAVRRPLAHGGLECLPSLLDALAGGEAAPEGTRWIVDANTRLDMAALTPYSFPQPEIHVVAAEYGAAAHARGWLRLDRTMLDREYTRLVDTAEVWAESDRTLDEVLQAYGRPSVTFGEPDPHLPKSLGYASGDLTAPLALFHLDEAGDAPSARLLAFRAGDGFFGASLSFTPLGNAVADESERRHHHKQ